MESWKRPDFPHPPNRSYAPPTSYVMGTRPFPEIRRPGLGVTHRHLSCD